jgi:hypothetical protein
MDFDSKEFHNIDPDTGKTSFKTIGSDLWYLHSYKEDLEL